MGSRGWGRAWGLGAAAVASAVTVVCGAGAAQAADSTIYVDKTVSSCSDTGPGSSTTPLCTIAQAMKRLTAGATVAIGNGTYAETVNPPVSGTASAPITITAWSGRMPVVGTGVSYGVMLSGRSYVVVSGLTVSGTVREGIYVSGGGNDTVSGNEVTLAGQPVPGQTATGIRLTNTSAATVTGNNTHDNSDSGIYLTGTTTGALVAHNVSSGNARQYQRNANGINVIAAGNTILGNITHDNEDSGIQFYPGGDNNVAVGNVTYNNGDHGIDDYNVTGGRLTGNTVFHNCTSGINIEGTSGNYVVRNNIAVDNAVYPAYNGIACSRRAGNIGVWDSAPASTTVDHNLVWLSKSGTMYVFGSSYSSLAAMQKATGQESHGVQADPQFVDPSSWKLQLQEGSAAIDRADSGAAGEQSTDLLGNARVDDPNVANTFAEGPRLYDDLGAYEFQPGTTQPPPPPPPPPPPSAPTAALSVTPTSGTASVTVKADASGSSDPQGQTLTYGFDFGDGTSIASQSSPTASHTYSAAGTFKVIVTVTNTSGLTSTATQGVSVSAPTATPPSYVGGIANNYSTSTHTSGYITVYKSTGVKVGDLVVLTLQLSGTAATGAVTGTDAAGNSYQTVSSVADSSGDRLVVLAGVAQQPLVAGNQITVSFPSAATYRLSGDEYAGVARADQTAAAAGTGSTFSSGTAQASSGGEVAFGAVATFGGTANPSWSSGWTSTGTYSVSGRYLAKAQQLPASGPYTATGTASGTWLAAVVTLAP
ncbi:MAG TPA: right-handed parallel beta-helix repeat-containing protein [Intrasporangium sp.]|nr:right-handed parallel beta-helix repeat-containing protein [Intrasporangium sp.]